MSLPSAGPVDALMTWAQFKDLFERGVIQEPVTYSGLTTLGTKFTVRRRIAIERRGRAFLSNKLSLQSIIITDSIGSGLPSNAVFLQNVVLEATNPNFQTLRLVNPSTSSRTAYFSRLTCADGSSAAGGIRGVIEVYSPIQPAGSTAAFNVAFGAGEGLVNLVPGLNSNVGNQGGIALQGSVISAFKNPAGAKVGLGAQGWQETLSANSQQIDLNIRLPPGSSLDIDSGPAVGGQTSFMVIVVEWSEQ